MQLNLNILIYIIVIECNVQANNNIQDLAKNKYRQE